MQFSGSESILIVDDEEILLEMANEILQTAGYKTATANNALKAIELLGENDFDLLFTDVIMPGMTGYQLVKEAQKIAPDMKILLTSGYQVGYEQTDIDSKLLDAVVSKPYGDLKLCRAVRNILDED